MPKCSRKKFPACPMYWRPSWSANARKCWKLSSTRARWKTTTSPPMSFIRFWRAIISLFRRAILIAVRGAFRSPCPVWSRARPISVKSPLNRAAMRWCSSAILPKCAALLRTKIFMPVSTARRPYPLKWSNVLAQISCKRPSKCATGPMNIRRIGRTRLKSISHRIFPI